LPFFSKSIGIPKKLKQEYKTKNGIKAIANRIIVRINYDWQRVLGLKFYFTLALNRLLGTLKAKYQ
jgi:hypothetical protein